LAQLQERRNEARKLDNALESIEPLDHSIHVTTQKVFKKKVRFMPASPSKLVLILFALISVASSYFAFAQEKSTTDKSTSTDKAADKSTPAKDESKEPKESTVTTQGSIAINGVQVDYEAVTGKLVLKDDALKSKAEMFFIAYTRKSTAALRPVTFCFNGGPGSSSVWLHMGMLGPKRIRFTDDALPLRPPYVLEDNKWSLLDTTDLVFIDPISTGYSRPAEGEGKEQFHGYEEDVKSVGQFIHDWTTKYQRWPSPKFVLGESYGGVRAAALAGHLQNRYYMELNGAIIVSGVINFQTLRFGGSNDLPFITYLPTYTATAWYHKALSPELQNQSVQEVVRQAEEFANGRYASVLLKGASASDEERSAIADLLSKYTGLSRDFVVKSKLRLEMGRFAKELLRSKSRTVGRFDSRYLGIDGDDAGDGYEYDASGAAIFGPFTATFNDYVRRDLGYKEDRVYEILTGNVQPWSYRRFEGRYVDATDTLRDAMTANPHLKVFFACGYYDLATPHFAMINTTNHLMLDPTLLDNFQFGFYEGGHMMYIYQPSMVKLREDLVHYYDKAVGLEH
jgi:carboxypeptidase C (cathepsin A)